MTNPSPETPRSILITLLGSLGDVTRGLTLVTPLRKHFPQAEITWMVEPKSLELVKLHPEIDRIIVFKRGSGLQGIIQFIKEIRKYKFDLCLDLQRHLKSAIFSRLSASSRIIGFHRLDSKEFNWLFSHERIEHCRSDLPKIEHYWKFLEYIGVPAPKSADVKLELEDKDAVFKKFSLQPQDKYIILVLGSSWNSKDWPVTGFHKVITRLSAEKPDLKFVLSGGKEHIPFGQELKSAFGSQADNVFDLCGQSSLGELCVLIKNAEVVVGPDSGPGHLAALLDVPFIGLFGPTDAGRTAPYGSKVSILSSRIGCSPCYRRTCPGLDKLCMRMIDPGAVIKAVKAEI